MSKSLSIFFIVGFFFLVGMFGVLWFLHSSQKTSSEILTSLPTPTPTPIGPVEVHSLDGTYNLIMKTVKNPDNTTTYSFITDTIPPSIQTLLYTKTVPEQTTFSVPTNAWSPENTYFFITEDVPNTQQDNVYVFRTDGENFPNGQSYLNVTSLFAEKEPDLQLGTVTGWDAPELLHVKSEKKNGKGPLYWFDVPNSAFYLLYRTQ